MKKEDLAAMLNGRTVGYEITLEESARAKKAGLVVVFGASDDLAEFYGAFSDEVDCYNGGTLLLDSLGVLDRDQIDDDDDGAIADYHLRSKSARKIEALWCAPGKSSWSYETDIPHSTFNVVDGDDFHYCTGIIFSVADLGV